MDTIDISETGLLSADIVLESGDVITGTELIVGDGAAPIVSANGWQYDQPAADRRRSVNSIKV